MMPWLAPTHWWTSPRTDKRRGARRALAMDDSNPKDTRKRTGKGIYLLPNAFTTGAVCGFYAIIAAMNGFRSRGHRHFPGRSARRARWPVARLTNTQSGFGAEYDSLSDMVSFGIAPALVVYLWSLVYLREVSNFMGKLGWLAAFIYATATAQLAVSTPRSGSPTNAIFRARQPGRGRGHGRFGSARVTTFSARTSPTRPDTDHRRRWSHGFQIFLLQFQGSGFRERVPFVPFSRWCSYSFSSIETATVLFSFFVHVSGPVVSLFRWNRKRMRLADSGDPPANSD